MPETDPNVKRPACYSEKVRELPLSKSQYTKGIKCTKRLWLYRERRHLATKPSPVQDAIFTQGHQIGVLAHQLFPGGVLISEDQKDPEGALRSTAKAMNAGAPAIYEAAFRFEDLLIRADIVARNEDGTWDLYEVKSSTKVKPEHLPDVAIQKYVLLGAGLPLRRCHLVHLNNQYRRRDPVVVRDLFTIAPLDGEITDDFAEVEPRLATLRDAVKQTQEPTARISSVCRSPYLCEFKNYCWDSLDTGAIHYLGRIKDTKRFELMDLGIELVSQIPENFELSAAQAIEAQVARTGKTHIEHKPILEHFSELKWPLYFLDFETVGYALPEFPGTRPYEPLTFQYSLHIQEAPGAPLLHREFLYDQFNDPRPVVARQLVADLESLQTSGGTIVAYHASFEKGRMAEMGLEEFVPRVWDLEVPFARRWFWDLKFQGSSSIKKVLPALVPDMNYKHLTVQRGDEAQVKYNEFIRMTDGAARTQLRRDLLAYCEQDSLAMVKVLERLHLLFKIQIAGPR